MLSCLTSANIVLKLFPEHFSTTLDIWLFATIYPLLLCTCTLLSVKTEMGFHKRHEKIESNRVRLP